MTFESEKKNCLSPLLHQIGFLVTFERERERERDSTMAWLFIYKHLMALRVKLESGANQFLENMGTRLGTGDSVSLLTQNQGHSRI
jgi:hypothetical protein